MNTLYNNLNIEEIDGSKLSVTADINDKKISEYKTRVLNEMRKELTLPGFRKGEVPEDMAIKHFGEDMLNQESLRQIGADALSHIIITNSLKVIGQPKINIDTSKSDIPKIKAEISILPEIKLGDYKEVAKKHNSLPKSEITVTNEDIQNVLEHIRKEKARIAIIEQLQKENRTPTPQDFESIDENNLPELTEQDFQELGNGAKNIDEFRTMIKNQIKNEKEFAETEKKRLQMLEEIIADSEIAVPSEIIDLEVARMEDMFKQDLSAMGMPFETYLSQIGKTAEELRESWHTPAEKRAKLQMLFDAIADKEHIQPQTEEIDSEVQKYTQLYPDANTDEVRAFVSAQLSNQAVLNFLENLK